MQINIWNLDVDDGIYTTGEEFAAPLSGGNITIHDK